MAPRSKLKLALAADKGLDFKTLKQIKDKKKHKAVIKDKRKKGLLPPADAEDSEDDEDWEEEEEEDDAEDDDEAAESGLFDVEAEESDEDEEDEDAEPVTTSTALMGESESDSESEVEFDAKIQRVPKGSKKPTAKAAKEPTDEDEESDIALSDLEDLPEEEREDLFVKTRLSINNQPALLAALKRISIPTDGSVPFVAHQTVISAHPTADKIEDISDDLNRELQLYSQCLEAAKKARKLLKAEGVPFSRPKDYFAEMVKDDGHMEKVKAKLIDEASNKKASAEARKQRDLKKFGKQVQVAKLQERHKEKRETLDKIKDLKRKRSANGAGGDDTKEADLFDVAVDNELGNKRSAPRDGNRASKRQKKDTKYGFGGKKRHAKSGDAASAGDLSGFSVNKMKGRTGGSGAKKPRLGKSKRAAAGGKR